MRIVIDMQGAQSSGSWNRGIGRYTMALAQGIARHRGEHEVLLVLNGAFPESVERIRTQFEGKLSSEKIRVWHAPAPVAYADPANQWRRQTAELAREAFIANLQPDFTLVSSLFEGLSDDAVTSVKRLPDPVGMSAVILYDLIPFIHRKPYLENPVVATWYLEKIEYLRQADLRLAISESSSQEGVQHLGLPSARCINISTDADSHFRQVAVSTAEEQRLRAQYGLQRSFVMYTGGIDYRKNIEGLIRAYAQLPAPLRTAHQLAIVCSVQEDSRNRLLALANDAGLGTDEVILTGFVSEEDLIHLYNLCALFVFPSWHEGFGLPALEAMRCGAPVIAANISSLPEVVGWEDALFDPHSDEAIERAIERALTDMAFRDQLVAHGQKQSGKFSWDATAQRAIRAMEQLCLERNRQLSTLGTVPRRPKLAYVSPLPPERSGISDYSAELLPVLAQHYDIEVVVAQSSISDAWINANCPIRSVQWLLEHSGQFERVLYHFGNSAFHQHMFGLLESIPGVVVLHDFYLSGVTHYMGAKSGAPSSYFATRLYQAHGYAALIDCVKAKDVSDVIWQYPCSRSVIENSIGTIVHSEYSVRLARQWYGGMSQYSVIPLMRVPSREYDRNAVRLALGFTADDFVVCTFGMLAPTKLNHRLLRCWLDSDLAKSANCHLVFVGQNDAGAYGNDLLASIKQHPQGASVRITDWADQATFCSYLAAADLAVQLRTLSRGETSAAVLDCMNYGLATIVNANGSMAELGDDAVYKLPDAFDDQALMQALEVLWRQPEKRQQMGAKAQSVIRQHHDPAACAAQYYAVIENFYAKNQPLLKNAVKAIGSLASTPASDADLMALAASLSATLAPARMGQTLLVDITELVQRNVEPDIQRIVCKVLDQWLRHPPCGWRVEPVYAAPTSTTAPYRYARQFTAGFLGITGTGLNDEPIEFSNGDIFFVLNLCKQAQTVHAHFYQRLRQQGVVVKFMVFDLLCILQPEHFMPDVVQSVSQWLQVVGEGDGAVCVSQAVAEDLRHWMEGKHSKLLRPFSIDVSPLGADIGASAFSEGLPINAKNVLSILQQRPSFLMVGTLEPRKCYRQVLDAFEQLWQRGSDLNLVIVGKPGWMVDSLLNRLRSHPETETRLHWLEDISDEYLEKIYAASTCLIAASHCEGFGLPLSEAAQNKLPIIARDIPVFREVAGEHAYYFDGLAPEDLASAIERWLTLHASDQHPRTDNMPWLTWAQSAQQLLQCILPASTQPSEPQKTSQIGL